MSPKERSEDLAFLLYLVPFVASGAYAIYLWAGVGLSAILPQVVYLQVTQNPYLFLGGFLAVVIAASLDAFAGERTTSRENLLALSTRLQWVAAISLVLAILTAWYAAGLDPGGAVFNLLSGRYTVVFPGLLVLMSFAILPYARIERTKLSGLLAVLLLLGSPLALYELGKRSYPVGMAAALVMIALGVVLLMRTPSKPDQT